MLWIYLTNGDIGYNKKTKNISVQCIRLTKVGPGKNLVYLVGWADMYMSVKLGLFRHSYKIYICYNKIK